MQERDQRVYAALDRLGIPYEKYSHAAAHTMEDCAAVDEDIRATH